MLSDVRFFFSPRLFSAAALSAALCLWCAGGCHRDTTTGAATTGEPRTTATQQRELNESVRLALEQIPTPTKSKYMAIKTLSAWQNPYLTVQDNMLVVHVTLADVNTSGMGEGGMLRPAGARRQDLTIRASELAAALNAVPATAWPYGRVIAVEEAHNTPARAEPEVRRTVERVMRTLGDLGVVPYEWSEGGPGLR